MLAKQVCFCFISYISATWVDGTNTPNPQPIVNVAVGGKSRGYAWASSTGDIYVFGGEGTDLSGASSIARNDFWRKKNNSAQWELLGGSTTVSGTLMSASSPFFPGGHSNGMTIASGNTAIIFGGFGNFFDSSIVHLTNEV